MYDKELVKIFIVSTLIHNLKSSEKEERENQEMIECELEKFVEKLNNLSEQYYQAFQTECKYVFNEETVTEFVLECDLKESMKIVNNKILVLMEWSVGERLRDIITQSLIVYFRKLTFKLFYSKLSKLPPFSLNGYTRSIMNFEKSNSLETDLTDMSMLSYEEFLFELKNLADTQYPEKILKQKNSSDNAPCNGLPDVVESTLDDDKKISKKVSFSNTKNNISTNSEKSESMVCDNDSLTTIPPLEKKKEPFFQKESNIQPNSVQYKRFQSIAINLLDTVQYHRFSSFFMNSVSRKEALDYYDLVYVPKDLRTILKLVKSKKKPLIYTLLKELERDIMLMFANCVMYNNFKSDLVHSALIMKQDVTKIFIEFRDAQLKVQ